MKHQLIIEPPAHQRLDRWLKKNYPTLPFTFIQKALRTGQIRLNGRRVKGDYMTQPQDALRIPPTFLDATPQEKTYRTNPQTRDLLRSLIVFEDESCIILNKPSGLAVQGGTNIQESVDLYARELCDAELRIVHRLDKDTAGLLILAKSFEAAQYYTGLFKAHEVDKTYQAVLVGKLPSTAGTIDLPLGQGLDGQQEKMTSQGSDLKAAITRYQVQYYDARLHLSWVSFKPLTGRKHQIRAHATQGLGNPILGDGKYGGKAAHPFERRLPLHLAATGLRFMSLTGQLVSLEIDVPDYFIHSSSVK
jgi:23S rRNA pseudouridine955/2504/2580 synthase